MNDLYLTDEQYVSILKKIEATVMQKDFVVRCDDSVAIGAKGTYSNCGFCNEDYTDKETALFPSQYPDRKTMKYRKDNHKCPFDARGTVNFLGYGSGCFFNCYLFEHKRKQDWKIKTIHKMVKECLERKL